MCGVKRLSHDGIVSFVELLSLHHLGCTFAAARKNVAQTESRSRLSMPNQAIHVVSGGAVGRVKVANGLENRISRFELRLDIA